MSPSKLVRDGIPDIIRRNGESAAVTTVTGDVFFRELTRKLEEEAQELRTAETQQKKLEELADIMEVVRALQAQLGVLDEELTNAMDKKREERGGFTKGYYLVSNSR